MFLIVVSFSVKSRRWLLWLGLHRCFVFVRYHTTCDRRSVMWRQEVGGR